MAFSDKQVRFTRRIAVLAAAMMVGFASYGYKDPVVAAQVPAIAVSKTMVVESFAKKDDHKQVVIGSFPDAVSAFRFVDETVTPSLTIAGVPELVKFVCFAKTHAKGLRWHVIMPSNKFIGSDVSGFRFMRKLGFGSWKLDIRPGLVRCNREHVVDGPGVAPVTLAAASSGDSGAQATIGDVETSEGFAAAGPSEAGLPGPGKLVFRPSLDGARLGIDPAAPRELDAAAAHALKFEDGEGATEPLAAGPIIEEGECRASDATSFAGVRRGSKPLPAPSVRPVDEAIGFDSLVTDHLVRNRESQVVEVSAIPVGAALPPVSQKSFIKFESVTPGGEGGGMSGSIRIEAQYFKPIKWVYDRSRFAFTAGLPPAKFILKRDVGSGERCRQAVFVDEIKYVPTAPDDYLFQTPDGKTCDLMYVVDIDEGSSL